MYKFRNVRDPACFAWCKRVDGHYVIQRMEGTYRGIGVRADDSCGEELCDNGEGYHWVLVERRLTRRI